MENTESRNKSTHLSSISLWQRTQRFMMEKRHSSQLNGAEKTRWLHVKEWNYNILQQHMQKQN